MEPEFWQGESSESSESSKDNLEDCSDVEVSNEDESSIVSNGGGVGSVAVRKAVEAGAVDDGKEGKDRCAEVDEEKRVNDDEQPEDDENDKEDEEETVEDDDYEYTNPKCEMWVHKLPSLDEDDETWRRNRSG